MAIFPFLPEHGRPLLGEAERTLYERAGALVVDGRRTRPRYFDGRFLAARDLTRDQQYTLTRQADLARAVGWGVVEGLEVSAVTSGPSSGTAVRLGAGLGVTPSGETVVLPNEVQVDVYDISRGQLLDAHLGLRRSRVPRARSRTGVFVLALRPVEYTANPARAYPTTVDGPIQVEDHDIVEATAVVLVPWPDAVPGGADAVRRRLARDVFLGATPRGVAADLLPLAMVHLDGTSVRWIDASLVRRGLAAHDGDPLGLGGPSHAARLAQVAQFEAHLRDVIGARGTGALSAADHFDALPPVGRFPVAALDPATFTQRFFPPEIDVDVTLLPDDEVATVATEALSLPSIDLAVPSEQWLGLGVLVLLPLPRDLFWSAKKTLETVRRPMITSAAARALSRNPLLAVRIPLRSLAPVEDATTGAWRTALTTAASGLSDGLGWYARRLHADQRADLRGSAIDVDPLPGGGQ